MVIAFESKHDSKFQREFNKASAIHHLRETLSCKKVTALTIDTKVDKRKLISLLDSGLARTEQESIFHLSFIEGLNTRNKGLHRRVGGRKDEEMAARHILSKVFSLDEISPDGPWVSKSDDEYLNECVNEFAKREIKSKLEKSPGTDESIKYLKQFTGDKYMPIHELIFVCMAETLRESGNKIDAEFWETKIELIKNQTADSISVK